MDFSTIKDDFATEINRSAEAYLAGQLQIATSADQRASVMASVFAAAGAALFAGTMTIAASIDIPSSVKLGGFLAGLCFLIGAAFCVTATMPVLFWLPGAEPNSWKEDVEKGRELKACLGEQAKFFQKHIEKNDEIIKRNARWFKLGAMIGIAAPIIGLIFWLPYVCRFLG
jgi:hypothetical protein